MLFTLAEIADILIAVVAAGYIFMDAFDPNGRLTKPFGQRLAISIAVAAPAIILHEFGHKFVALALGYQAVFHAAYMWLGIGILLKLISFPFLFVVPAYVSIYGPAGPSTALVAFAGPAINGLLWLAAFLALKFGKFGRNTEAILYYTRTINGFLFILNLIPIPGFDGYNMLVNLF